MRVESPAGMAKPSSDHPEARLGQTIHGKWTLESVLGTGGMAAVYLARHTIGRREAIKILHPEVARDAEQRKRFDQEARAANELGHPGAVEIRDVDITEDGCPFMVMELLEGETLGDVANRNDGLPLPDLLRYVDEVLDVLVVAHARGIVHRDIKLGNLFLTKEGKVKVLDFGIARIASSHITRAGARLGTTAYMPPEQLRGEGVDGRADVFAVGATMFRIIAKRRVHEAKTEVDLIAKMAMTPAPMLATVCEAPPHVCLVVDRALAFRVAERYPDARTMQLDVQAVRRGEAPPFASSAAPQASAAAAGATRADVPHRRPIDSNAATVAPPKTDVGVAIPLAASPPSRIGFEPTGISSDDAPSGPDSVRVRVMPAVRGDEPTGFASAATILPAARHLVGLEPTATSARSSDAGKATPASGTSRVVGSAMPTIPDGLPISARGGGTPSGGTRSVGAHSGYTPLGTSGVGTPSGGTPSVNTPSGGTRSVGTPSAGTPVSIARSVTPVDVGAQTVHVHGEPPLPQPSWGVPAAPAPSAKGKSRDRLVLAVVVVLLVVFAAAAGIGLLLSGDEASAPRKAASTSSAPLVAPGPPAPALPAPTTAPPGAKRPAPTPTTKSPVTPQTSAPTTPPAPATSAPPSPPPPPASTPVAPSSTDPPGPPRGKPPKGRKGRGGKDED